jgi:hypothetical protein
MDKKKWQTCFGVSKLEIMVPGHETADVLACDGSDCTGETPTEGHTELIGTRKLGLLSPTTVYLEIVRTGAGCEKGLYKTLYGSGGYVEGERGEYEGCRDATAGRELVGQDDDETSELFETEHDVSLVGQISIGERL